MSEPCGLSVFGRHLATTSGSGRPTAPFPDVSLDAGPWKCGSSTAPSGNSRRRINYKGSLDSVNRWRAGETEDHRSCVRRGSRNGRGGRDRTGDHLLPKQIRYLCATPRRSDYPTKKRGLRARCAGPAADPRKPRAVSLKFSVFSSPFGCDEVPRSTRLRTDN
jgi:hypothetical protein